MRLSSVRVLLALFLVAALILGSRLVWVASRSETGWQTLGLSWYNAALEPFGVGREPIGDRDPAEQAEIWLAEVDRVLAAHPDDAQIAMGAAWMLDSPGLGFRQKYTKFETFISPIFVPRTDDEAISQAVDPFEAKCAKRCLELAARATELEPENVDWWRLRALLLFRECWFGGDDGAPRDANWQAVLDECARHDPDNALYDYLAALRLWNGSGKYDWDASFTLLILQVHDAERFAEGVARYEQGQRKRHLAVGRAASPAVAEFLHHARHPRREEADAAYDRLARIRGQMLPARLGRWQEARSGTREQAGDIAEALALLRQQRRVAEQMMTAEGSPDSYRWAKMLDRGDIAILRQFAKRQVGAVSAEEVAELEAQSKDLLVDYRICGRACGRVDPVEHHEHFAKAATPVRATEITRPLCRLLVIVGVVGWALGRYVLKAERAPLGRLRHLSAWLLGWGATLFFLGVCPAETLGPDVQAAIIACGACVLGVAILVVLCRKLIRLFRLWAQGPERLPVLSIIGLITVWQATVAVVLTAVYGGVGGHVQAVLDWAVDVPLAVLGMIALPAAIVLGVLLAFCVLRMCCRRCRTGRLVGARSVALGLMLLSAILVTGTFALKPNYLVWPCWPPVCDWEGADGAAINDLMNETYSTSWLGDLEFVSSVTAETRWLWALRQWQLHAGLLVSPGLSLLLVALWHRTRRRRERQRAAGDLQPTRRARCGGVVDCVARSALAMAACLLLVYLAAAPGVLRAVEADYQHTMGLSRDPETYWTKVQEAEAAIRADPAVMKEIRAEAADEIRMQEEEEGQSADEEPETEP